MTTEKYYKVAGHVFCVKGPEGIMREGYAPFEIAKPSEQVLFTMDVSGGDADMSDFVSELTQEDEGQVIEAGRKGAMPVFCFGFGGTMTGTMTCSADYRSVELKVKKTISRRLVVSTVDNALMVLYALATANKDTLLMHASVTVREGKGYLFIAPSGTGKSTHSQLWLKCFEGTHLLNDDNPVIRRNSRAGNRFYVYGSPWSGKTPCYINEEYPVGAIVKIYQAPYNKIVRLEGIHAYIALTSSVSGKRWDKTLADGLHNTLNSAAQEIGLFRLDCLPDIDAAKTCWKGVNE